MKFSVFSKSLIHRLLLTSKLAFAVALLVTSLHCVSVNLPGSKMQKASDVSFTAPADPFKKIDSTADAAWKSKATGSTIAFSSACGESADLPIETVVAELTSAFDEEHGLSKDKVLFDGRESLQLKMNGKIDGVETRIEAIVYKKNKCTFTLSLVSLPQNIKTDAEHFARFRDGFHAP